MTKVRWVKLYRFCSKFHTFQQCKVTESSKVGHNVRSTCVKQVSFLTFTLGLCIQFNFILQSRIYSSTVSVTEYNMNIISTKKHTKTKTHLNGHFPCKLFVFITFFQNFLNTSTISTTGTFAGGWIRRHINWLSLWTYCIAMWTWCLLPMYLFTQPFSYTNTHNIFTSTYASSNGFQTACWLAVWNLFYILPEYIYHILKCLDSGQWYRIYKYN